MNHVFMFTRIFSILIFITTYSSFAQLNVDNTSPYDVPNYLINDVLMSSTSSNAAQNVVLSTGTSDQIGYFNGTASNIGINEGVIMSTHGIGEATPQNDGNQDNGVNATDIDLLNILTNISNSNQPQRNTIVYEFDFVAGGSEIEFEYVFASDEYSGYTCSQFNDVFGFFISGPGINGPYSNNAKNIALIPDPSNPNTFTNTPVMINTLNSGYATGGSAATCASIDVNWSSYSVFFVDNLSETTVAFNGFTKVLKARSEVECGETYHIKLAIADIGDDQQNSAVFLKQGSFEVGTPLVLGIAGQTSFIKCVDHVVVDPMISGGFGDVSIEWSQNGIVFSNEPIQTFTDNGEYTITVFDGCQTLSHVVNVTEYTNMSLTLPDTIILCEEMELIPTFTGGAPAYNYNWSGAGVLSNSLILNLSPGINGDIQFKVIDNCGFEVEDYVHVITPEELTIDAPDKLYLCEETTIEGEYSGGHGTITSYWELNGVITYTDHLDLTLVDFGTASYHVLDECGKHLIKQTIITSPGPILPIKVSIERNTFTLCDRDDFIAPMFVSGGAGGVNYEWFIDGELVSLLPNYRFKGTSFTSGDHILSFRLTDLCGNIYEDEFLINKLDCFLPNVFSPNKDLINDGFTFPMGDYQSNVILRIHDRWGREVYLNAQYERCSDDEIGECWTGQYRDSGEQCLGGVYFYTITFKDGDVEKGTVTLFTD